MVPVIIPAGVSRMASALSVSILVMAILPLLALLPSGLPHVLGLLRAENEALLPGVRTIALLGNTFIVVAGTAAGSLVLGTLSAFFISSCGSRTARAVLLGGTLALVVPTYVAGVAWFYLLGPEGGLGSFVRTLGADPIDLLKGPWPIAALLALCWYPIPMLAVYSGLRQTDREAVEAAALIGGPRRATGVLLRGFLRPIAWAGFFVALLALAEVGVPGLFQTPVLALHLFTRISVSLDPGSALLPALGMLLAAAPIMVLWSRVLGKQSLWILAGSFSRVSALIPLAPRAPAAAFLALLLLLSVGLPLGYLSYKSFSADAWLLLWETGLGEATWSLILALGTATALTLVGLWLAYASARGGSGFQQAIQRWLWIPFMLPAGALGLGLILAWNRPPFLAVLGGSPVLLVLAYLVKFAAVPAHLLAGGVSQVSPDKEEAAATLGAPWRKGFSRVLVPAALPALLAAWALTYLLVLGDLGLAALIVPPGISTLPLRIFNAVHYGPESFVAALCIALVFLSLLPAALWIAVRGARRHP